MVGTKMSTDSANYACRLASSAQPHCSAPPASPTTSSTTAPNVYLLAQLAPTASRQPAKAAQPRARPAAQPTPTAPVAWPTNTSTLSSAMRPVRPIPTPTKAIVRPAWRHVPLV